MVDTIKVNPAHYTDFPNNIKIAGTLVTSTAAELNIMDGVTASTAEINAMDSAAIVSMTNTEVGDSDKVDVQIVFKDAAGVQVAEPVSGLLYISKIATGITVDAADNSLAALTNGVITNLVSNSVSHFVSSATGLLGIRITSNADSYWVVIVLPNGKLLISGECIVDA